MRSGPLRLHDFQYPRDGHAVRVLEERTGGDMTKRQPPANQEHGDILLYQTEDGQTKIEVRMAGETVWLSIHQMAELFQRDRSVISKHISNIYDEKELNPDQTCAKFAQVQREGLNTVQRQFDYFN